MNASSKNGGEALFPKAQDFISAFNPREYLEEYFSADVDDEDRFMANFLARALKIMPDGMRVHEFGGGPALYSVAALAARAREIHFSDLVPANLDEVRNWLAGGPDVFDWKPYIRLALESEGRSSDDAAVAQREGEMRRMVTRLMICDAQSPTPLGNNKLRYELVVANHCTDVAATTTAEWFQVMRNVSELVIPGGWLIVSVSTGSRTYKVGNQQFRCVDLQVKDVRNGFQQAGYDPDTVRGETHEIEEDREYTGIIAAIGRKFG